MKISDLSRAKKVNEGFIDDIANIYKNTSHGKQRQLEKNEKAAYDYGLKSFGPQINRDLSHAINSGFVQLSPTGRIEPSMKPTTQPPVLNTPPGPTTNTPPGTTTNTPPPGPTTNTPPGTTTNTPPPATQQMTLGGRKLDPNNPNDAAVIAKLQAQQSPKKMTNEAAQQQTIGQWIQQYMRTQTRNLASSPMYQSHVDGMAQTIEQNYARNKKVTKDDAKQLWDILWAWSKIGNTGGGGGGSYNNDRNDDSSTTSNENSTQNVLKLVSNSLRNLSKLSDDEITSSSVIIKQLIDKLTKVIT
jgi:hypothetical protein